MFEIAILGGLYLLTILIMARVVYDAARQIDEGSEEE
jgi:hypothetical protein